MTDAPEWARWKLTVIDLKFGHDPDRQDTEYHADEQSVLDALTGDQVQCDDYTIMSLMNHMPPKIGESNHVTMGDVELKLERVQ